MKVTLGAVLSTDVDAYYHMGIVDILMKRPPEGFEWANASVAVKSGPLLAAGRAHEVNNFLDETDGDVLIHLDSDQTCTPETFWNLLSFHQWVTSEHPDVGITAGVTWMSGHPKLERPFPNLYMPHPQGTYPGQLVHCTTYPENSIVEYGAVGLSNYVISRECAEAVRTTESGRHINPFHHLSIPNWRALAADVAAWDDIDKIEEAMRRAVAEADQLGEDLSYCARVREKGYRILVHTGLEFGHSKNYLLDGDDYRRALQEWRDAPAPEPQEPAHDLVDR